MGRPMTPAGASRYFRWSIGVMAVLAVAASAGALVTYLRDRELISGPTRAVNGQVVEEEKGFLGIRNLLTVEYEAGGQTQRKTIPVKGDGIRGPRVSPYFYKPGASVELLVSRDSADAVRTEDRWTPAVQIWAAAGGGLLFLITLMVPVAIVTTRQHRRSGPAGG